MSHIFSQITVASVVVIEGAACFLPLPEYSHTVHGSTSVRITQPVIFMLKPDCFFGTYYLKMALQRTITSNANVQWGCSM